MKRASLLLVLTAAVVVAVPVLGAQGTRPAAPAASATGRLIEIEGTDQMKFSVATINAKPGEDLRVRIKAVGTMPKMAMSHNFVLLNAGVNATEFTNQSVMAGATGYIAPALKNQVIASTSLVGAGETAEVAFKAPVKPGTYTFLCSFPGHFAAGMRGTLVVK